MDKQQYLTARALVRQNGRAAYAWIAAGFGWPIANALRDLADAQDWLAERADIVAYCARQGVAVDARSTRPAREYRQGRWAGVQA